MALRDPKIAIVDYGLGNLFSIERACQHAGMKVTLTGRGADLQAAEAVLLPGVGAFADAMEALRERQLIQPLKDLAGDGKPLIGICLGLQLMMSESHEFGVHAGLGLIEGTVERLPGDETARPGAKRLKVPQVGWNRIQRLTPEEWDGSILAGLEAALKASDALEDLTGQMKGVIDSARSGDATQRAEFGTQLKELAQQLEKLVNDASYQGLNLLNSTASKLSVRFSDKATSKLDIDGVDFNSSAYFLNTAGGAVGATLISTAEGVTSGVLGFDTQMLSAYNFDNALALASFNARADVAIARLDETISNLQSKAATLATNVAILQVRSDFTAEYIGVLESGAGKLTVADLNEEGVNLLALQTRQQLGIQALSFAGQAEQSILGLFR
ncbi:MAG TPA: imidazole glycerol phosphate synthase subunit HisH [Rhodospirillaceae bacterium]|jgi:imidazole glycerol phosphate synthase glutamine amidotransferase subunit|nr:imidazole glycerol phosphate synthase subunit HisH [Rhodospirillaceae bacterium]HIJ45622.1 imidazole glycerol phosphate synthase subunit HisH [Rhodospirillaceae bacterium]HIJ93944.1 imidazole glycerol phosphate synthase subunit HisH [Rhodospirillaceae bacterium]HJO74496.1 imidazole glycerol phosphate synthase subunit HisH [Rhodospirillales bacterium]